MERQWSAVAGTWFLRLFILPHTIVGVGMIAAMLFMPCWALLGTDAVVPVTRTWTTTSKGKTSYRFEYRKPGVTSKAEGATDYAEYERMRRELAKHEAAPTPVESVNAFTQPAAADTSEAGPAVAVRSLRVGPYTHTGVVRSPAKAWGTVGMVWAFGLFWNGILSVFFYMAWVAPARDARVRRHGETVLGRITSKSIARGSKGGKRYVLSYEFTPARSGIGERADRPVNVKATVSKSQWDAASEGDEVWVFHWPGRRRPSALHLPV